MKRSSLIFFSILLFADLLASSGCGLNSQTTTSSTSLKSDMSKISDNPGPFKIVSLRGLDNSDRECLVARGDVGKFGGTLQVCTFGSGPKTFNCWAASDAESSGIGLLMFERLVDTDAWTGKIYPRLARSFTISADKRDYTFVLRKGLKWSDGYPITAEDVVFTFAVIVGKGFGNASSRDILSVYGKYPVIEKLDNLTVKFHTEKPFVPFLNSIKNVPIGPKHILEPETRKSRELFNTVWGVNVDPASLVVSGPFKLKRYVPGQRVELERNPYYAVVDKSKQTLPYLDNFLIVIVPDQNTKILKFYAGEIDLLDIRSIRGNDAALMKQREIQGDYRMYDLGPDDGTTFLMFNLNRRKSSKLGKYYVSPHKQRWFNSQNFRLAVNHAIDRKAMMDNVLRGVGLPLYTAESPASLYCNKALPSYPKDLNLAAGLLARAGFTKRAGRLFDSEGNPVEFSLLTNAGNSNREAICVMIANDLKKLGIKVNFQPLDFNVLIDKVETSLDWEAVVMGLTGSKLEPYEGANVWKSNGRLHMFDQRLPDKSGCVTASDARNWEKRIDSMFDQGAVTFDEKERRHYFNEYQRVAYEQQPFIYLITSLDLTAVRNTVGNYKPTTLGITYPPMGSLHNIEEIYLRK